MSMTFKKIGDAVLGELGLPIQDQYFGNSSTKDQTLPTLSRRSVKTLIQEDITGLKVNGSITMTTATSYDLPSDFNYIVPDTMNAQNQERILTMPTGSQEWFWLQARNGTDGLRFKCRIVGDQLQVNNPQSGIELIFEYHTKNVVTSQGAPTPDKETFTKDSDRWLLDDELLIMDLKWRFGKTKSIEGWQADLAEFNKYKKTFLGQEGGSQTITVGMGGHSPVVDPYIDPIQ